MLNIPYYNINLEKELQYSYLLHLLIRTLGLVNKGRITKQAFVDACKCSDISRRSAYRYWEKGAYKNKFIKSVGEDYVYITGKDTFELIIEKVPSSIYKNIKTITDLKDFLHTSRLGRAGIQGKQYKRRVNTGKGLRKIASETNSHINTVINRNIRSTKKFGLKVENRTGVIEGFKIKLCNAYKSSIRIIRNKYCAVKKTHKTRKETNLAPLFKTIYNNMNAKTVYGNGFNIGEFYELINNRLYYGADI